ncbi:ABC transporter ATP-binding protein [Candidatus Woesearchaeota archaeon]|nr:ABC transporter ATP-binding protein [Candidatus Woesearchaeota archaeon]
MEVVQLKEVTKVFDGKTVLDRVNFNIEEGDIFGIIGQSGSGKSTLLNMIIGFYEPDEGKVLYQLDQNKKPREVHKHIQEIKKKFGFAAQISSFYPKLTIKENLFHFGKMYGIKTSVLKKNRENLLEFTELLDHKNKLAEHLSVGMQKRLDLSCSLIHKPKILLLDEPTADLDPVLQKEILYIIKQANKQGITVIIASHHLNDIEHICNKVALIHKGKISTWGTVEEVKKPYLQKDGAIHLRAGKHHQAMIEHVKRLPVRRIIDKGDSLVLYSPEIQETLYQLVDLIRREKITLEDLDIKKPSLQDIFESIVQEKETMY